MSAVPRSAAVLLCVAIASCIAPTHSIEAEQRFVEQQRAAAILAQQQGDLARALNLWRSIAPLSQADGGISLAINSLQQEIARRSADAKQNAELAYRRGARRDGDRWLRQALALQPDDEQARDRLAQRFSQAAIAQRSSKTMAELPAPAATRPTAPELQQASDGIQSPSALEQHIAAANRAREEDNPERELDYLLAATELGAPPVPELQNRVQGLRQDISKHWYKEGSALFQADLPMAIEALEKSLAYDPRNQAAQVKLKQARTLLKNLQKIQTGG